MRFITLTDLKNKKPGVPGSVLQQRFHLYFCLALFGLFYLLACTSGNKLTYDSQAYLAAAKSLREGMGLLNQFGKPYVAWPPLYPVILSLGIDWIEGYVFLLHLLCGLGTIYLWGKIAEEVLKTSFWYFFFLLVLSLSTPFLMVFVFAWSEAGFIFLFTAHLYCLQKFINDKKSRYILWAAQLAFLMLLQRNAGIFLLAGVAGGVLLNYSFFSRRQLKYLFLYSLFAVSGFGLWNIYVSVFKGNEQILTEVEPMTSLPKNAELVFSELGKLYVPEPLGLIFGLFVLVPCLAFLAFELCRQQDVWLRLLLILLLTYLMVWVVVPALWVIVPAGKEDISRFLSPGIPVLYLLVSVFLERRAQNVKAKVRLLIVVLSCLWLLYPVLRLFSNAWLWHKMPGL